LLVVGIKAVEEMRIFLDLTLEQSTSLGRQTSFIKDVDGVMSQDKIVLSTLNASIARLSFEI
jgi:hypothetical protein